MDTLTISGIANRFDGVYECDIVGMIADVSSPDALTVDEAALVQQLSRGDSDRGVRGNEIAEAFLAGDVKVRMAIAIIVLARNGKDLPVEMVRNASMRSMVFELQRSGSEKEGEEGEHPTMEGAQSLTPSTNGGSPSRTLSVAPQGSDPEAIGAPA